MWGLFAGEARKQPPHFPFSTAIPKDLVILDICSRDTSGNQLNAEILRNRLGKRVLIRYNREINDLYYFQFLAPEKSITQSA